MSGRSACALSVVVAAAACSETGMAPDAGGSIGVGGAAADAGTGASGGAQTGGGGAGGDGGVVPSGKDCADTDVHGGRVCIREGWFVLSRWSTAVWSNPWETPPFEAEPEQPVYLDAFWIDEHEVTHGAYWELVQRGGAAPLPELCGYTEADPVPRGFPIIFDQTSAWTAGAPAAALVDHPVVCVTRSEARAYCAAKGGRLPTAVEWMKAGRDVPPDTRRYPWGDEPPADDMAPTLTIYSDRAVVHRKAGDVLNTLPVYSDLLGRSPRNVLGLAGNASEHLSTCEDDLYVVYPPHPELVRPEEPPKALCAEATLVAGTSWRSEGNYGAGTQTLYKMVQSPNPLYVLSDFANWAGSAHWGYGGPIDGLAGTDPAGNDRRSWRLGFRCVYPLE